MKKVVIITYYWPPAGGPGVQRVLKFARYLPRFGWQPIVLTVSRGEYPALDPTLEAEVPSACKVYRTPSLEPGPIFRRFVGMPRESRIQIGVLAEKPDNWRKRVAFWIRTNLFIPDAKVGWLPFAVRKGLAIIQKEKPHLLFSSSPPPTVHLIAKQLARNTKLQWVADFRDPWTDIHYYEHRKRLPCSRRMDEKLEAGVLREADRLVFVSKRDIDLSFSRKVNASKCVHLPNGYDEADFQSISFTPPPPERFVLMHVGAAGSERNPQNLFRVLRTLLTEAVISPTGFRLVFVGPISESVLHGIQQEGVSSLIERIDYVPHRQALQLAAGATALLLLITRSSQNRRILPGKTFEYIRLKKPILALGPPGGEVDQILQETNAGRVLDYADREGIEKQLRSWIRQWQKGRLAYSGHIPSIRKYSRERLTQQLAAIFDQICEG